MPAPSILLIGTLDTKGAELLFVRDLLRASGLATTVLDEKSIVIFRHDAADVLELTALRRYDQRTYGGMTLEFLSKKL